MYSSFITMRPVIALQALKVPRSQRLGFAEMEHVHMTMGPARDVAGCEKVQ